MESNNKDHEDDCKLEDTEFFGLMFCFLASIFL